MKDKEKRSNRHHVQKETIIHEDMSQAHKQRKSLDPLFHFRMILVMATTKMIFVIESLHNYNAIVLLLEEIDNLQK